MEGITDSELNIELPDGKRAYGWLREVPNAPVVVMTHGNTGGIFEHPYDYATRQLIRRGYSVYRFAFYSYGHDARSTTEVTLQNHTEDIDAVVRYFKSAKYRKVSVVGHSIGGLAALASEAQEFDALVIWDGSHPQVLDPKNWPDLWIWEPALNCWRFENGVVSLIDARFVESFMSVDAEARAQEMEKPIKFISAGESRNSHFAYELFELVDNSEKAVHVIDGADHGFTADKHADELIAETLQWLDLYGR